MVAIIIPTNARFVVNPLLMILSCVLKDSFGRSLVLGN